MPSASRMLCFTGVSGMRMRREIFAQAKSFICADGCKFFYTSCIRLCTVLLFNGTMLPQNPFNLRARSSGSLGFRVAKGS